MSTNGSSLRERYGEWALVTGASAGIGLEFARAFARAGLSCVLAARREDRLKALGDELSKAHGIQTRVVAVDLAAQDGADKLAGAVADLPIGILVNNAGFGYAGRFDKLETDRLRAMVMVNCVTPVVLTSRILPAMVKRGRGAVIIVGSVAGRQPLPLHAVYSATKGLRSVPGRGSMGRAARHRNRRVVRRAGTHGHRVSDRRRRAGRAESRRARRERGGDRARGARQASVGGLGMVQLRARQSRALPPALDRS